MWETIPVGDDTEGRVNTVPPQVTFTNRKRTSSSLLVPNSFGCNFRRRRLVDNDSKKGGNLSDNMRPGHEVIASVN